MAGSGRKDDASSMLVGERGGQNKREKGFVLFWRALGREIRERAEAQYIVAICSGTVVALPSCPF